MNQKSKFIALATAVASVIAGASAQAQNANYNIADGDIVLFAQKFNGTQALMVNIGTGQSFRDTTVNLIDIKNIATEMAAISGLANWWDDADLYWGIAGVRSASDSNAAAVNGDGHRTIYTTKERTALGTEGTASSSTWTIGTNTVMTTSSSAIIQMTTRMETVATTDRLLESTGSSNVDNQNPFLGLNPGTAFGGFPGGVMANFDAAAAIGSFGGQNAESALDLYRILGSTSAAGTVDVGTLRVGQYQGSFVVDQGGDVSFIVNNVPEPTSTMLLGAAALLGGVIRRRKSVA